MQCLHACPALTTFQAIEIYQTTRTDIFLDISAEKTSLCYGTPPMLSKYGTTNTLPDSVTNRLKKEGIALPEVNYISCQKDFHSG